MNARLTLFLLFSLFWSCSLLKAQPQAGGSSLDAQLNEAQEIKLKDPLQAVTLWMKIDSHWSGTVSYEEQIRLNLVGSEILARAGRNYHSLQVSFEGLRLAMTRGDSLNTGRFYYLIGRDYHSLRLNVTARQYYELAHRAFVENGDSAGIADAVNLFGTILEKTGKTDSALVFYEMQVEICRLIDYKIGLMRGINNAANMYLGQKQFSKAIDLYHNAAKIASESGDEEAHTFVLINIARANQFAGDLNEAERWILKAYSNVASAGLTTRVNLYTRLSSIYHEKGDFKKAYAFLDTANTLSENAYDIQSINEVADMSAKYESEKKAAQIERLNEQEAQSTRQRNYLIALLGVAVAFIILACIAFVSRRRSERLLAQKNAEMENLNQGLEKTVAERTQQLTRLNRELDELFYRSSHDLRSPITQLSGLLQFFELENAPLSEKELKSLLNRSVSQLSNLNTRFCRLGDLRIHKLAMATISLAEWIPAQADLTGVSFSTGPGQKPVLADPFLLKIILAELMDNARRAGSANAGKAPQIDLTVRSMHSGDIEICVKDNGPGLHESAKENLFELFHRGTGEAGRFGLGLYMARLASEKMNAGLRLVESSASGTAFAFVLRAL